MARSFDLRTAEIGDADDLAETVRQGFDGYRAWAPVGWTPPPPQLEAARIREGLERQSTWCVLATDAGEVAGHVAFNQAREREEPRADIPRLAHLWMLFVREPWWGSGLATLLNGIALAEAGLQGYDEIRLHTPFEHVRARAFYEREGWRSVGTRIPEPMLGIDLVEYRHALP
ncbi:MAG: GNAT family N-acetyltransferase [Solirubrobacteraceae bacterium]